MELALESDPSIALAASRIDTATGDLLIASGRFDTIVTADVDVTDSIRPLSESESIESRDVQATAGVRRLLRSGQSLEPAIVLTQSDDPGVSSGTVAFTVRQPLVRGRSPRAVTSEERARRFERQAVELEYVFRVSERLLAVIDRYWQTRAARLDLEILRSAERRAQDLLGSIRRLVEADLTPAADLIQLEADVVSRQAARLGGERALFLSRQLLRAEIGLPPEAEELGLPSDSFPTLPPRQIPPLSSLVASALASRADLDAERRRLAAANARLTGARDALKPRLDLLATPSYTGIVDDDSPGDALGAFARNVPGVSTSLGLSLLWPIENRVARGSLIRLESFRTQQELALAALRVEIGTAVPSALDAVRRNAEQLALLERAVGLLETALRNEEKKLRAGSSTLLDVLDQRDRLINAERSLVDAGLSLARSLVALRFETGALVEVTDGGVRVHRLDDLTTSSPGLEDSP